MVARTFEFTSDTHADLVTLPPDVVRDIWTAAWNEIAHFEVIPGFRLSDDVWILPYEWIAWGAGRRANGRTINFAKVLPSKWTRDEDRAENVIRRLKRIAVLLFTRTVKFSCKVMGPKKPRSWVHDVRVLISTAAQVLSVVGLRKHTSRCPDGEPIFASLTDDQFEKFVPKSSHMGSAVIPRLNALLVHGEFDDWPTSDVAAYGTIRRADANYQPFADEFTAVLSDSALWLTEALGPRVVDCWARFRELHERERPKITQKDWMKVQDRFLSNYLDECGDLDFKYHIKLKMSDGRHLRSILVRKWSELSPVAIRQLAIRLQDAHAIILALCMAPRNGELASLPRNCLREYHSGNMVTGFTFKLSETEEERDWPIPSVAVKVVQQQVALAEILDPDGGKLFVSFRLEKQRQNPRDKLTIKPQDFTDRIYLPDGTSLTSLCIGSVHSHRFRKTVARLAALALVGANQILFDILGHRDPEMTMNYILADPHLQEEMQRIAKEAAVAIAKTAFDDIDGNGGPAAGAVAQISGRLKARSGMAELDEESLAVAATLLSQDGHVTLVRKGVLCTKTSSQMGECVRSLGVPDIGNCQINCMHRLELAAAKLDHKRAIEQALVEIAKAGPMMRAWWQSQILTHLIPFPELRAELLEHDLVRRALADIDQSVLDDLWSKSPAAAARQLEKMR